MAMTPRLAVAWSKAYGMARRRRFAKATRRYQNPYTPPFNDLSLSPSRAHLAEIEDVLPALAWRNADIADPKE
jgi:hypothetical protein